MDAPLGPFRERATAEGGQDESGQQRAGSACVAREVSESGTRESTFIVSERKRLRMAPEAIASKKAIGAWSSRRSRVACSTREARSEHIVSSTVCTAASTSVPQPSSTYTPSDARSCASVRGVPSAVGLVHSSRKRLAATEAAAETTVASSKSVRGQSEPNSRSR